MQDNNKSLELQPDNLKFILKRVSVYEKLDELENAVSDLKMAVQLNPEDAASFGKLGLLNGKLGKFDVALKNFKVAIQLDPNNPHHYFNRGVTKANHGLYETALTDVRFAHDIDPKNSAFSEALKKIETKVTQIKLSGQKEKYNSLPSNSANFRNRIFKERKLETTKRNSMTVQSNKEEEINSNKSTKQENTSNYSTPNLQNF